MFQFQSNLHFLNSMKNKNLLLALAFVCSLLLINYSAVAQQLSSPFSSIDISGATQTQIWAISGNTIAGQYTDSTGQTHGFSENLNGSDFTTIDYLTPKSSAAVATGYVQTQVRGISGDTALGVYYDKTGTHAFTYNETTKAYTSFNDPNGVASSTKMSSYAFGQSGNVLVGYYNTANGNSIGYTDVGGKFTDVVAPGVGTTGNDHTYIRGISGSTIVGDYVAAGGADTGFTATLDKNGNALSFNSINSLPDGTTASRVNGIDGSNLVGWISSDGQKTFQGFIENGSTFTPVIDSLAGVGGSTYVTGVSGDQIVGYYTSGGVSHGFTASIAAAPGAPAPPMTACLAFAGVLLLQAVRNRKTA
jgi:hypothetical protein